MKNVYDCFNKACTLCFFFLLCILCAFLSTWKAAEIILNCQKTMSILLSKTKQVPFISLMSNLAYHRYYYTTTFFFPNIFVFQTSACLTSSKLQNSNIEIICVKTDKIFHLERNPAMSQNLQTIRQWLKWVV